MDKQSYPAKIIFAGAIAVVLVALEYARWTYYEPDRWVTTTRPFVYRALVPWMASGLEWVGLQGSQPLTVLLVVSAIGLYLAMIHLAGDRRVAVWSAVGVILFLIVFIWQRKSYDVPTALFFALGLAMIDQRRLQEYFALFTIACANRETMFLLTLVFMVFYFGRMGWKLYLLSVGYQGFLWAAVRICLMVIYAGYPGVAMMVRPLENLQVFLHYPIWSVVHWAAVVLVVWMVVRRQQSAGRLMRVAFWVMAPVLMVMYLVLGWAFEVRVFAELFPVVWVMIAGGQLWQRNCNARTRVLDS